MKPQRLSAPMGLLLDRESPLAFDFEGQRYFGWQGDTIASALLANQQPVLSRSFKYHRPRGPLSMAGHDANTLVQLGGEPNVLADRRPLAEGMVIEGQNCNGSLKHDRDAYLGAVGRFMPVGFYYRAFFKPRGIWQRWEKLIRQKAGLGKLDLSSTPGYHDKQYLFYDVVVVGGGPAGISAALTAADAGAEVLLVEEQALIGGSLTYHRFDVAGVDAQTQRESLLARVDSHPRIDVRLNALCNAWFSDNYLPVIQGNRMHKVRAKECIIASGSFEQHVVFRNNDLPGIMACSAALRLMAWYAVKPGNTAVVLTGNDDGYLAALALHQQGVTVAAVVDMRAGSEQAELAQALADAGIRLIAGAVVYEALAARGSGHVRGVDVRAITGKGQVAAKGDTLDCDLVCMSAGYMPAYQLLCQAGAQLHYDDQHAAFSVSGLPDHLHIAGSVNGVHQLDAVIEDGRYAAHQALRNLGVDVPPSSPVVCTQAVNYDWPIFPHPKGKEFVDFDEDLQVRDIVNATRLGYRDIQLVKRFSTVGMGPSQGRHSALPTARLVADATDRSVSDTGVTTARPPFAPETLAHAAGRIFDPYRRTPMHDRHVALGAKMIPAGSWQRPGFYGPDDQRDACVHSEAQHVREKVGLIDVSTLGGIEFRGPDAAEFVNRLYTFAFLKQPIGKTRYAVLTSEHGVVIDDGVACRIAKDHFYITATTTGVDRVYRDMTRWNAQWRLDVDIYNVTSAFAAVNLAGPDARRVLQSLDTDVDLSPDAFPYLAYREGHLQGIPVRLLRVGFVGELGYEIHVQAGYGEAVWDLLMTAGAEFDIKPFGVETQRLLRLEKGHIIVGQDTDGMSHPGEVGLAWSINHKKPFFVGRRSVDIVMGQPLQRQLVGFSLPPDTEKPEEGHLVVQGEDVRGHVTSCEYSPATGKLIGLAYTAVDTASEGDTFAIRGKSGQLLQARVEPLPFYDPNNTRQEM